MFWMHYAVVRKKLEFVFPRSEKIYNDLKTDYSNQCISILIESNFLNDEDQHMIESEFSRQLFTSSKKKENKNKIVTLKRFSPLYIAMTACILASLMRSGSLLLLVAIIFPLIFYIKLEIQASVWKHTLEKDFKTLTKFIDLNHKLQNTLRKSLQFIHDSEVVSLGYNMITAKLNLSSKVDQSRMRSFKECVKLRHSIYTATTQPIRAHRNAAIQLIDTANDNSPTSFVCKIPLQQLGPCFDNSLSDEELTIATDSFCLAVLRDLNKFLFQQRSELIRIILLNDVLSFSTLESCCDVIQKEQSSLEEIFNVFFNYKIEKQTKKDLEDPTEAKSKISKHKPLLSAVRSAQMHLRTSLSLYISIQELLENDNRSNKSKDADAMNDSLKECVSKIQMHSESSAFCLEEVSKLMNCLSGVDDMKIEEAPKPQKLDNAKTNAHDPNLECIMLDADDDFVEDQIFEGDADDVDAIATDKITEAYHIGGRRKCEQESKAVIRELTSVLQTKTSDEHREIIKSKLFPRYKPRFKAKSSPNTSAWFNTQSSLLKVPRRPVLPRKKRTNRKIKFKSGITNKTDDLKSWEIINKEMAEPPRIGLGVGFSSSMAAQAAAIASQFGRKKEDDVISDVIGISDDDL